MKVSPMHVALISVFAALQAVLSTLPFTITVGVEGQITLGLIGGAIIGVLLGPVIGGSAVLIGSFIGVFLNPAGALLGVFTVIPPFLGSVGAGCVKIRKGYIACGIIVAALLIFYAHSVGREVFAYPWLYIVGAVVALSPLAHIAGSSFNSKRLAKPVFGIVVASFVGVLTDGMVGSSIAMWYFSGLLSSEIWLSIMFIYPIERIFALVITSLIAIPVYYGLKTSGLTEFIPENI
ncbi:MAG: hypothetical protein JSW72_07075 [Candidatus Bathyarchaeota archaeon]|nr:MAG: hypothetical protein JSW72_07075 [Candidatus Bathyarchaeota archaeon]